MNIEPKILLTIKLDGVLGSKSEKKEIISYKERDFEGKEISGFNSHYNKMEMPCHKRWVISNIAYEHFISPECPYWYNPKDSKNSWEKLPKSIRLHLHLNRLAEYKEYSFEMIDEY